MSDAHARFQAWLNAGAEGDPPRDLAVHASVCPGCRQSIAALDLLATVDPALAQMPAWRAAEGHGAGGGLARGGRPTGAAVGVVLSAVIIGTAAWQLIGLTRDDRGRPVAQASQTPNQGVLGATATARPTSSPRPSPSPSPSAVPTATPSPLPTAAPTRRPLPRPTPVPTAVPTPTPATPSPTPVDTTTPTPLATETPIPSPSPSTGGIVRLGN